MPIIDLEKTLTTLPKSPGIYKFINEEGRVIYIGKAKDLSKRIRQYFQKNYQHSTRTQKLLENIFKIETIGVDSELEAMILEHNLIKQLQPKYNVIMKDDKRYVYIKITKEDFPRIQIVRKPEKDGAKYIGPKTAAHKVKDTLMLLKKIFPFRHCNLDIEYIKENHPSKHEVKVTHKVIKYPCIDYYIKRCVAPCIGTCNKEQYAKIIENVEKFLEGKGEETLKSLKEQMINHAQKKDFEKAARLRDKIKKIEDILETQKVQNDAQQDKDVINYCITQDQAYFNLFQIRLGKLINQENFILSAKEIQENENQEVLEAFLKHYYEMTSDLPKEILIPHELEDSKELESFLETQARKKIKIIVPQRGTKNRLLEMSLSNARIFADRNKPKWQQESELTEKAVLQLQKTLKLEKPIKRLECYDISHLSGTDTVGSMIVFEKGIPKSSHYRKFHLRTVQGKVDDYKSMQEVLARRFLKISDQQEKQDHVFKKASKKDQKFIEKQSKLNLKKIDFQFYILKLDQKIIGYISLKNLSDKIAELNSLWISEDHRGHKLGFKLIKNTIAKTKAKRIYIICKQDLKDYYQLIGFEEIKKVPEQLEAHYKKCLKKHKNQTAILAYDKTKYKVDESFSKIPDLVIIDGGKGQLSAAGKIFEKLNLNIPYIALAKKLEEIFTPGQNNSIVLEKNNEALKLLQRARDEAHRFAISYNRNLRSKKFKTQK